ncbi:hypothetical protein NPJ82_05660 [Sphingomonas sp. NY01]|jgi:hypothetical protein|uniref:hypothetical protein n=1 Tax=Sphingomonas sp. NY01 TaxID=2968057 RepID=UPI00315DCA45
MWHRIVRLFTIKSKFEAFLIIYGLAVGACQRGAMYLDQYPGWPGKMMFAVCPIAVFMAGARILDSIEREQADGDDLGAC